MKVFGKLTIDEDEGLCIKMKLTPQNPDMYDIPLEEILEDYIGKEVRVDILEVKQYTQYQKEKGQ